MPKAAVDNGQTEMSLRGLLADYDRRVERALSQVLETTTGTDRVRALHVLRQIVITHDSVVGSTLCPLLQDLPGGPEVAGRLRQGCEVRADLLGRFQSLSQGTEPHNVYPVFGPEIEAIVAELRESFQHHVEDETTRVGELLESTAGSLTPEAAAARMAIEAGRAPVRAHRVTYRHPTSRALRAIYRGIDRMHDWNDSHHGWPTAERRAPLPVRPQRKFTRRPPSIPDLLSGYDQTVETVAVELAASGQDGPRRAAAAYRLAAAIAVHDSIVGGTVCRLLEAVPEGRPAASVLENGCRERASLLEEWNELVRHNSPAELFEIHGAEANRIIDRLIASFRAHESHETDDVSATIEQLRQKSWKSSGTGLVSPYLLADWPNPDPAVLAAHMALWAKKAPTHAHPLLSRHPSSRLLRNLFRYSDHLQDRRRARRGWPTLT